jgi:hypothetical protein
VEKLSRRHKIRRVQEMMMYLETYWLLGEDGLRTVTQLINKLYETGE